MYEKFGAVVTGSAVEFKLFFPDAAVDPTQYSVGGLPKIVKLQVVGDFQPEAGDPAWDLATAPEMVRQPHPNGMLYYFKIAHLPDGFYQYKYFATYENGTTRWCGDPCTKYVATKEENAAFVIGGNDVVVQPVAQRRPLRDLVVYELMIDDFTALDRGANAPADAVLDKIDYLQSLGINAIEFMPWTAWRGGEFSWGYDPFLFFAVENRYIEDPTEPLDRLYRLKRMVHELHKRGIQVIMDGVFNHVSAGIAPGTGFPYLWLYQDPNDSPYIGGFGNAGYFEEIDYNNACTQQFVFDVCKFWLDEYQLDGIRFDYTLGFDLPTSPSKGISRLVSDIKARLTAAGRENVVLILEHLTDNRYEAISATNRIGATACWYDRFMFDVPQQAANGHVDTKLMRVLDTGRDFAADKGPAVYIENHDHSSVVNRCGGRGQWWKVQAPLIALFTCHGAVMIHNGQEFGDDHYLPEGGSNRVIPRAVNWNFSNDATGQQLLSLHRKVARIRREHPSLRSSNFYPSTYDEAWTHFDSAGYGVDVDKDVAIYHRWGNDGAGNLERFIIVLNFSAFDQFLDVPFSENGDWEDLLNGGQVNVQNYRLTNHGVSSNWGKVYFKRG